MGGGGHHPPHLARLPDVALIRVKYSIPAALGLNSMFRLDD